MDNCMTELNRKFNDCKHTDVTKDEDSDQDVRRDFDAKSSKRMSRLDEQANSTSLCPSAQCLRDGCHICNALEIIRITAYEKLTRGRRTLEPVSLIKQIRAFEYGPKVYFMYGNRDADIMFVFLMSHCPQSVNVFVMNV